MTPYVCVTNPYGEWGLTHLTDMANGTLCGVGVAQLVPALNINHPCPECEQAARARTRTKRDRKSP